MAGLLIKDIKLFKNQKSFFIILIGLSIFFLFVNESPSFVIGYTTFVGSMFVVSSISYDEYNRSNVFLFTLPITRKEYVVEKYVFGFLTVGILWIFSAIMTSVYSYINIVGFQVGDWFGTCFAALLVTLIFMSLMIPIQLKFGQENGNTAIIICLGCIAVICFLGIKFVEFLGVDISGIINSFNTLGIFGLLMIIILATIICLRISYAMSVHIMQNKEF